MGKYITAKDITIKDIGLEVSIDLKPLDAAMKRKQIWFTSQVAVDCNSFIPFQQGTLRESVSYPYGLEGGVIEWNGPYGHYVYMGIKYVNPITGKSGYIGSDGQWHGWPGKKVPTAEKLNYHTPGTGDHWDQRAAAKYMKQWIDGINKA